MNLHLKPFVHCQARPKPDSDHVNAGLGKRNPQLSRELKMDESEKQPAALCFCTLESGFAFLAGGPRYL